MSESPNVLRHGEWVTVGGIQRWVPAGPHADLEDKQNVAVHVLSILLRLAAEVKPRPLVPHRFCQCGCLCLPREVCPNCLSGEAIYERRRAA